MNSHTDKRDTAILVGVKTLQKASFETYTLIK